MARTETIRLEFVAELRELRKNLAEMPDMTEDAAKEMVTRLRKQYKKAERESKKLAKAMKNDGQRMGDALEGAKRAAEGVGGAIGGTAGQVEHFAVAASKLSGALGPAGTAALAVAAGVTAAGAAAVLMTGAAFSLASSAHESAQELEKMGVAAELDPAKVESLKRLDDTLSALKVSAMMLQVTLGGPVADSLEPVARVSVKTMLILDAMAEGIQENWGKVYGLSVLIFPRIVGLVEGVGSAFDLLDRATGGLDESVDGLMGTWQEYQAKLKDGGKAAAKQAAEMKTLNAAILAANTQNLTGVDAINAKYDQQLAAVSAIKLTDENRLKVTKSMVAIEESRSAAIRDYLSAAGSKAATEQQKSLADATKKHAAEMKALNQIILAANTEGLTGLDAINAKYDQQLATVSAIKLSEDNRLKVIEAMGAIETNRAEAVGEYWASYEEGAASAQAKGEAVLAWMDKKRRDSLRLAVNMVAEEALAGMTAMAEMALQTAVEATDWRTKNARNMAKMDGQITQAERDNIADLQKQHRDGIMKRFRALKRAQTAEAIFNSASAYLGLVGHFSYMGWGAPIAAGAVVGPALATQLAKIQGQSPPEFPRGGVVSPDHVTIAAQPGEGVVSLRGMQSLGESGLDEINRGGSVGPTVVNVQIGASTLATAIADGLSDTLEAVPRVILGRTSVYGSV